MKLLLENFRSFITEQESGLPQIYCDMDGVLVDFERGVVDQINKDLKNIKKRNKFFIIYRNNKKIDLVYDPELNQPQLRFSIALD